MEFLSYTWLPILLSAVFVFVVSSLIHMATPWHRGDQKKLPAEDQVLGALRGFDIPPGNYAFPMPASMKDVSSPPMQEKYAQGPVGYLTLRPKGPPAMGKSLLMWFIYALIVSLFAGYVAAVGLGRGADYLMVFRVAGAVAVLGYAFTTFHNAIWWGMSWGATFRFLVDGVIYGLVTAGTFGWLWPRGM
jgi:hypothetical protein